MLFFRLDIQSIKNRTQISNSMSKYLRQNDFGQNISNHGQIIILMLLFIIFRNYQLIML